MKKTKKAFYVYKLLNTDKEIIYIGKTHDLKMRLKKYKQEKYSAVPPNEIDKIEYVVLDNECDHNLLEAYLIDYYKPKYNTDMKNNTTSNVRFEIPNNWIEYNYGGEIVTVANCKLEQLKDMEKFLNVADVMDILKFSKTKTYSLIHLKDFPKITIGRNILIPETEFYNYLNRHLYKTIDI